MDKSTWEGSKDPDVHADPLEPAMPTMSKLSNRASPSINLKQKFTLPGNLLVL